MIELNHLPTEIRKLILGHLYEPNDSESNGSDCKDPLEQVEHFQNARLVCREWNGLAMAHLYQTLLLAQPGPDDPNFTNWNYLLSLKAAKQAAQCVVINVAPDWEEEEDDYPAFTSALDRITELPNLKALRIVFPRQCQGEENLNDWEEGIVSTTSRFNTLNAVFGAMVKYADTSSCGTIRSLTIVNLQNVPFPDIIYTETFRNAFKDVQRLHLLVTDEYCDFPQVSNITIERKTFEPFLQQELIPCLCSQLTALSLVFHEYWGLSPGNFDGRGLWFPNLKSLTLGTYIIGYYDQFDWVLNQKSLQALYLDACAIVTHLNVNVDELEECSVKTSDWQRWPQGAFGFEDDTDDIRRVYTFSGTWEALLDAIRVNLVNLTGFRLNHKEDSVFFCRPAAMETEITMFRYVVFEDGFSNRSVRYPAFDDCILKFGTRDYRRTGGVLTDEEKREVATLKPGADHEDGDRRALEDLLQVTIGPRRAALGKLDKVQYFSILHIPSISRFRFPRVMPPSRRSWVGCVRCKRFKKKCSEHRPTCQRCQTAGASCEYGVTLRWGGRPFNRSSFGDCISKDAGKVQRLDLNKNTFIYISPSAPRPGPATASSPSNASSNESEITKVSHSSLLQRQVSLSYPIEYFPHLSPLHRSGLQYFTERTVKALAPHPQVFEETCTLILPMVAFNDALLQGTIALAAVHRLASCKTTDERAAQSLVVAGFQARSSRSLCQRLSECDDDQQLIPLLAAARTLFICEVFASEPSADRWSVHFRGARGIISRLRDKSIVQNPTDELRFLMRWFDMTESLVCHSMSDLAPHQTALPSPSTQKSEDEPVFIDMYLARTRDLLGVFKEIARLHWLNTNSDASEASTSQNGQGDAEVEWLLSYLQSIIDRDRAHPPPVHSLRGRVFSLVEVAEYRLSNQVWQLTALILIHRRLRHIPRSSPTIQQLVQRIVMCAERMTLRDGLTPATLLTPPLFFAGYNALGTDRARVKDLLQGISISLGLLNTQKALDILERYWQGDSGDDDALDNMSSPEISRFLPY
ncbi:hypothetical protein FZEAL_4550 [Fusarium zealandicum]|uniref:Zn(2)-C6 fungal-type domain-containing protein n=1 Tax=Fusarium zealandicum TaxID=1053134 RepID=A0A8H4ULF2_9HYPO|nr:hypothetical protein FZEAL_4550 [Fusarium zealandicum]